MEPELTGTGTCAMLLTYGRGPSPDCATACPESDVSEESSCQTTPSSARVKAVSYHTIQPSVFCGRCYFSETYFAASRSVVVVLAVCHTAVPTGGTALSKLPQTCPNSGAGQTYCTDTMFKGYDPPLNPPVGKQHQLHLSSAFVMKPLNCGKNSEFCYTLESRPKFMKKFPKDHYPSELS